MLAMLTQLNARVAQSLKRRVAMDRASSGKTSDIIVEVALENFFSAYGAEQRRKLYEAHHRKPYGGLRAGK